MQGETDKILAVVAERVTPKKAERTKIAKLANKLESRVSASAEKLGMKAAVRLEGSVAKDTWLSREGDIDVFMRVPATIPRKSMGETSLKVAREAAADWKQIERFAEHPYLEVVIGNVRANIVPCYDVPRGKWLSATDRTPFHTDYVKKSLNEKLKREVRLLKKFMKGVGVYGAEIKVGGFSGYLCELLVLNYGSFVELLKAFADLGQKTVVDLENLYGGRENEVKLLFEEPLVVLDPVDMGRNVASAVRPEKLSAFVAASRAFLEMPNLNFFYPPRPHAASPERVQTELKKRGPALVFVVAGRVDAVPDILWGQLYKSQRSLRRLVELNDFSLLRDFAWSDEKKLNILAFEVEERRIPPVKKHLGPPLEKKSECENFLKKHSDGVRTVSGPYIEDGRWVVLSRRKFTDVVELLSEKLKDGGRGAGVAAKLSEVVRKEFKILVNDEISTVYAGSGEFADFLTAFLSGRPVWLRGN